MIHIEIGQLISWIYF